MILYYSSIQYGIGILQSVQNESKSLKKSLKVIVWACLWCRRHTSYSVGRVHKHYSKIKLIVQDVVTENEFEKRLLADVIPPSDIDVTFDDIGALEKVKDTLKELVMLPLQRPELFCKGQLTKVHFLYRLRFILLFKDLYFFSLLWLTSMLIWLVDWFCDVLFFINLLVSFLCPHSKSEWGKRRKWNQLPCINYVWLAYLTSRLSN